MAITYAAFFSDRGFRYGMKTIVAAVTGLCMFSAAVKYFGEANIWLCLMFLAVTVPLSNLLAVGGLWAVIWYRKRTGSIWRKQKIEPYVGPVTQKPVDVVRDEPKRLEHRQ